MRKVIAFSFVFIFVASVIRPALPFADYILNYDYISKVLCINNEKPKMQCNGKCHLSMQLQKVAEEEKVNSNAPSKIELEDLQPGWVKEVSMSPVKITSIDCSEFYINLYEFLNSPDLFRPPKS